MKGINIMYNDPNPDTDRTHHHNRPRHHSNPSKQYSSPLINDYGPKPLVVNINKLTLLNNKYRTTLWTGCHMQVTLMSINVEEDIGLEIHPETDQFIRIEQGEGLVLMGDRRDRLNYQEKVCDDFAILIPAGKWHNIINTGCVPLKLYSIYAPPHHPHGTIHKTKAEAQAAEEHHDH
jgi:mannose-6-phosphate isomerase-like protein (cupin superfamily)